VDRKYWADRVGVGVNSVRSAALQRNCKVMLKERVCAGTEHGAVGIYIIIYIYIALQ
jgi:hypothetical protein